MSRCAQCSIEGTTLTVSTAIQPRPVVERFETFTDVPLVSFSLLSRVFGSARHAHSQRPLTTGLAVRAPGARPPHDDDTARSTLLHLPFVPCRYVFNGEDTNGFSVVDADSFDEFTHTHELAHNLGCLHNRENSETQTDYSHGMRYCDIDLDDR